MWAPQTGLRTVNTAKVAQEAATKNTCSEDGGRRGGIAQGRKIAFPCTE